jgi:hypothetical protein
VNTGLLKVNRIRNCSKYSLFQDNCVESHTSTAVFQFLMMFWSNDLVPSTVWGSFGLPLSFTYKTLLNVFFVIGWRRSISGKFCTQCGNWSLPFNQTFNTFLQACLPRLCAVFFCVCTKFVSFENVKFNMSWFKKSFYQVCRDVYERGMQLPSPAEKFQFSVIRWWGNQCLVAR